MGRAKPVVYWEGDWRRQWLKGKRKGEGRQGRGREICNADHAVAKQQKTRWRYGSVVEVPELGGGCGGTGRNRRPGAGTEARPKGT